MASCAIIALAPGRRKRRVSNWVTRTAWSKWPSWESMNWRPIKPQATRTQVARARPFAPESSLTRAGRERLIGRPSFGRIRVAPWMRAACSLQLKGARLSPAEQPAGRHLAAVPIGRLIETFVAQRGRLGSCNWASGGGGSQAGHTRRSPLFLATPADPAQRAA